MNRILEERGAIYGVFKDHAVIAQNLRTVMRGRRNMLTWYNLAPDQRQALETIADKIARILNGDPNYIDNWVDIAGYATLVSNRLKKEQP